MCQVLGVSKSGYYAYAQRLDREETKRERWSRELNERIVYLFHDYHGIYGSPRIHQQLKDEGYEACEKTVANRMRKLGLYAVKPRRFITTTDSDHQNRIYENKLDRNFKPEAPNKAWATDITYIHTGEGFLYLNPVLDLFSRRVISYKVDDNMKYTLPLRAIQEAVAKREPDEDWTHHSDRGSQYSSTDYIEALEEAKANVSMSRKGNPYDNACVESFFASMKKEFLHKHAFQTKGEAMAAIDFYIDLYNNKRKHSSLGYTTPLEYELAYKKGHQDESTNGTNTECKENRSR